jgi:hypothetical protein
LDYSLFIVFIAQIAPYHKKHESMVLKKAKAASNRRTPAPVAVKPSTVSNPNTSQQR